MEQQKTVTPIVSIGDTSHEKAKEPVAELINISSLRPEEPVPELIEIYPLRSIWLDYWLWQHRIPQIVARKYCREVHYKTGEKEFAAIGFQNDAGGWLIRNRYHRLAIGTKGPTHLANGSQHLAVFTDFVDLLTLVSLLGLTNPQLPDLLLLDPTEGVWSLREVEPIYRRVHLFCQYNGDGNRLTAAALRHHPPCIDQRRLFAGYKNLND